MNYLIPTVVDGQLYDGKVIRAIHKCNKKCCEQPCVDFYIKLKDKPEGFYTCPSGYSVYKSSFKELPIFYVGMLVKKHYKKRTNSNSDEEDYIVINEKMFYRLLAEQENYIELQQNYTKDKEIQKDLLHDVRKLDSLIKSKSDNIIRECEALYDLSHDILNKIKNINAMEEVIACKYSVFDLVSNIGVLAMGDLSDVNIYKKFDKVRYILAGYKNKDIPIEFCGETNFVYKMNLSYADILPFLLLENAIKYTIGNHNINVTFEESGTNLFVDISSFGPYCEEDELKLIFDRYYRGRNTIHHSSEGTGVGLFLVKEICNLFDIDITISSDFSKTINGIKCGWFKVSLIF